MMEVIAKATDKAVHHGKVVMEASKHAEAKTNTKVLSATDGPWLSG